MKKSKLEKVKKVRCRDKPMNKRMEAARRWEAPKLSPSASAITISYALQLLSPGNDKGIIGIFMANIQKFVLLARLNYF